MPNLAILVGGSAEGGTPLNAFDNALRKAGVGDWNLVKVSSILPPGARVTQALPFIERGNLVPAVIAQITSDKAGEVISSAVGIGKGDSYGVIMEHSAPLAKGEVEKIVRGMLEEAFLQRGIPLKEVYIVSSEHTVQRLGCAVAVAILWWG